MPSNLLIEEKLVEAGVKSLREFGCEHCTEENIFTDEIYSALFLSMLKGNKGHGRDLDLVLNALMNRCTPTHSGQRS